VEIVFDKGGLMQTARPSWITLRFRNKAASLRVSSLEEQFLGNTHRIRATFKWN